MWCHLSRIRFHLDRGTGSNPLSAAVTGRLTLYTQCFHQWAYINKCGRTRVASNHCPTKQVLLPTMSMQFEIHHVTKSKYTLTKLCRGKHISFTLLLWSSRYMIVHVKIAQNKQMAFALSHILMMILTFSSWLFLGWWSASVLQLVSFAWSNQCALYCPCSVLDNLLCTLWNAVGSLFQRSMRLSTQDSIKSMESRCWKSASARFWISSHPSIPLGPTAPCEKKKRKKGLLECYNNLDNNCTLSSL